VSDISRGGCYVETLHPLATGAAAQLRLTIADIFLDIGAKVVSSDPMFGMGLEFVVVPTAEWDKLPQIIKRVSDVNLSRAVQQHEAGLEEAQHHMQAALHSLEQAQKQLQEAKHSKGGHRAQALHLTENAIREVQMACKQGRTIPTDPASMGNGDWRTCELL
jgi:hypothetical protein